ncbi:hypothetical protein A2U01_0049688, partial [Trifolium medium]|nr:hypothetical protein [Trifolium medium]
MPARMRRGMLAFADPPGSSSRYNARGKDLHFALSRVALTFEDASMSSSNFLFTDPM